MSGVDSLNIVGKLLLTSNKRKHEIGLSQVIDMVQGKFNEITLPHAGSSGSPVTVELNLPTGVTEALVLILMCDLPVVVTLTGSDVTDGPLSVGLLGFSMLTMTPGEGIVGVTAYNKDTTNDATLEYAVICLGASTDQPTYWFPPATS